MAVPPAAVARISRLSSNDLAAAEQRLVDAVAETVNHDQVHFLDARSAFIRDTDFHIAVAQGPTNAATVATGHGDYVHAGFVSRLDCREYIWRIAGS